MPQSLRLSDVSVICHVSYFHFPIQYDTIRYDTVDLRALKSWRDGQLNLAHGPKTKNNESAFLPDIGRQAAPALQRTIGFDTQYRTSDVAENLGRYVSCTESSAQEKNFELI